MSATGDSTSRSGRAAPGPGDDRHSRSERRSARRHARRRQKASRLFFAVAPAVAVIAVVAVLFPMLASPGSGEGGDGSATTSATASVTASTHKTAAPGGSAPASSLASAGTRHSALLAVMQDGKVAVLEFVIGGPHGGLVLGFPGVTLLRAGDRFAQLGGLYSPDHPQSLQQTVADALAAPVPAVASVNWSELRGALAASSNDPLPAQRLDAKDGDAGRVAEAIAAVLSETGADGSDAVWGGKSLAGDAGGFLAAVAAVGRAAQGARWTGQGVDGTLVETTGFTYLEPDVASARSALSATGAGG